PSPYSTSNRQPSNPLPQPHPLKQLPLPSHRQRHPKHPPTLHPPLSRHPHILRPIDFRIGQEGIDRLLPPVFLADEYLAGTRVARALCYADVLEGAVGLRGSRAEVVVPGFDGCEGGAEGGEDGGAGERWGGGWGGRDERC